MSADECEKYIMSHIMWGNVKIKHYTLTHFVLIIVYLISVVQGGAGAKGEKGVQGPPGPPVSVWSTV